MAWESRGDRRFYYRYQRDGRNVRKIYCGAGEAAKRAAAEDVAKKEKRAADRAELAVFQAKLAAVDQLAEEIEQGVDLLTEATLLALGFHQHRGQWRLRRDYLEYGMQEQ